MGLRSYSFLKNSLHRVSKRTKIPSPNIKPTNNRKVIPQCNPLSLNQNHKANRNMMNQKEERSNIQQEANEDNLSKEVFTNDSFGDSRKNISEEIPMSNKHNSQMPIMNQQDHYDIGIDPRIDYALKSLDLLGLNQLFKSHHMSFNDMLFLSKEDYIDLGLTMVQRNRLGRFCEAFQQFGKDYSYDEVIMFFAKNRNYTIKGLLDKEASYLNSNDIINANLNYNSNENRINDNNSANIYNNEVFMPGQSHDHQSMENDSILNDSPPRKIDQIDNEIDPKPIPFPASTFKLIPNNKTIKEKKQYDTIEAVINPENNKIERTQFQLSSSGSSLSNSYAHRHNSSQKKANGYMDIIASHQKINQEVDEFLSNYSKDKELINLPKKGNKQKRSSSSIQLHPEQQSEALNHNNQPRDVKHDYYNISNDKYNFKPQNHKKKNQKQSSSEQYDQNNQNVNPNTNPKLNRNESLTNLHQVSNSQSSVDILTEYLRKKETLRSSLNDCNNKINEKRKLLKMLEDD